MADESASPGRSADIVPTTDSTTPARNRQAHDLQWRLIAGHPTAQAEVAETFLGPVRRILASRYSDLQRQHPDWIDDAATDAVMGYLRCPDGYDPQRRSLLGFLVLAAQRDLFTRLREELGPRGDDTVEGRHSLHIISIDNEEDESIGKHIADQNADVEGQVLMILADAAFIQWLQERITDPADWAVVQLLMQDATQTEEYAKALGLDTTAIDPRELAHRAYDHKDRVKKRVQRLILAYRKGKEVRAYNRRGGRSAQPPSS